MEIRSSINLLTDVMPFSYSLDWLYRVYVPKINELRIKLK
jgi:hypothetical protein